MSVILSLVINVSDCSAFTLVMFYDKFDKDLLDAISFQGCIVPKYLLQRMACFSLKLKSWNYSEPFFV